MILFEEIITILELDDRDASLKKNNFVVLGMIKIIILIMHAPITVSLRMFFLSTTFLSLKTFTKYFCQKK